MVLQPFGGMQPLSRPVEAMSAEPDAAQALGGSGLAGEESEVSFGHGYPSPDYVAGAPPTVSSGDAVMRTTRWKRSRGGDGTRPSKSPRREDPLPAPWPRLATRATPETVRREADTEILPGPPQTAGAEQFPGKLPGSVFWSLP